MALEGPGGGDGIEVPIPPFLVERDEALGADLRVLLGDLAELPQLLDDARAPGTTGKGGVRC